MFCVSKYCNQQIYDIYLTIDIYNIIIIIIIVYIFLKELCVYYYTNTKLVSKPQ